MKQILITDHLYMRLKTIADEQDEHIQVMYTPSREAGASGSIDGRGGLGNASVRPVGAREERDDMTEFRRLREEQKAGME